jgi:hypothetical protein
MYLKFDMTENLDFFETEQGLKTVQMSAKQNEVSALEVGMKTDRIRMDITDIIFVFIFLVGFGFKYG